MSTNFSQRLDVRSKCANIDALYGPFESVQEACTQIPSQRRVLGRTVAILTEDGVVEYWWKEDVTDSGLVKKLVGEQPQLKYTDVNPEGVTIKKDTGEVLTITVFFKSPNFGNCTVSVEGMGTRKEFSSPKGYVTLNLGEMNIEGTSTFTVTAVDGFGVPAPEILSFTVITGGIKLSSNFDYILEHEHLNTQSEISIVYNASVADTSKVIKVYGEVVDSKGNIITNAAGRLLSFTKEGSGEVPYSLTAQSWDIGVIPNWGNYALRLFAFTGDTPDDESEGELTTNIVYPFSLLNANDFVLNSTVTEKTADTNTVVSVPFTIVCGDVHTNTLKANGSLYHAVYNSSLKKWEATTIVEGVSLARDVNVNQTNYWSLGKITEAGDYIIRMWATSREGTPSPITHDSVEIHVKVDVYTTNWNLISDDSLICDFEADGKSNANDRDKNGIWENSSPHGNGIYFELHNLNYTTNGWKNVDETLPDDQEGEKMLKFTGESYGILKRNGVNYNPLSQINSLQDGFTAEIIFRTRCIGELENKVMTSHIGNGTNSAGFSASYDTLSLGNTSAQIKYDVSENEWIHATFVIDKQIHTEVSDVQDYAPDRLMTIYVNGSMCTAAILTNEMIFESFAPTILLNSATNPTNNNIDYFGQCEIKAIRFYNRALRASEVNNNYIVSHYTDEEKERINGRNLDVLPIVEFININATEGRTAKEIKNNIELVPFSELNKMKIKAEQKKRYAHAKIVYKEPGEDSVVWPHCFVQTQGTSSLAYPVKNYKITLYTDENYKDKYKVKVQDGWKKESKFTLKCDFMEAAHLNNTPTCMFYNDMIDALVETGDIATGWNSDHTVYTAANDHRSPARRDGMFDAIKGFPCIVKYYESEADYYDTDTDKGVYVGTYMFNIDKSGKSLGFDAPAKYDTDGETEIQVDNPRAVAGVYPNYDPSKSYEEGGRCTYDGAVYEAAGETTAGDFNPEEWGPVSPRVSNIMQSFEGVANKSNSAGCFYSFADYCATAYRDDYCLTAYNIWLEYYWYPSHESQYEAWKRSHLGTEVTLKQYVDENYPAMDLDAFIETYAGQDTPFVENYEGESPYKHEGTNNLYLLAEEDYEVPYKDEYEYFAQDYEMRYDWDDIEEGEKEFWGDSTWGLKRMIDWVSEASKNLTTFKNEFSNYFIFEYCAIYYLQMMLFGQVDNAGKNSMWDTWDGLHWIPRPYDLDSQAGLDNTGFEIIKEDAELIEDLSPFKNINNTPIAGKYFDNIAANAKERYLSYNTRTSKFWIAFATAFRTEINALYGKIRNYGIYSIENISTKYLANTSDIIGEAYYNRDMTTKFYKLSDIGEYISRMHGNRVQKFKSWMKNRLIYCDTLFDYHNETDSLNGSIGFRSDAVTGTTGTYVFLGVKTYSPQYVRITVGTDEADLEGYCSRDSRYRDPYTQEIKEGLLFQIPITSGNKEMFISGAGGIREFENLSEIKPSSLILGAATRLTRLDLSGTVKLTTLSLLKNKFLRYLNCNGCTRLGTEASGAQLNLSNCENLKEVYLDDTKLTSIAFPVGGALKTVSAKNSNITGIGLSSCQFLSSVDVSGCEYISSYVIDNCPSLTSIVADELPIVTVNITDCDSIKSISLKSNSRIDTLVIDRCSSLEELYFNNNRSAGLRTLNLSAIDGLKTIVLTGSVIENIRFASNIGDTLRTLSMSQSNIKNIAYDTNEFDGVDMLNLGSLTSLSFYNCVNIEKILNLNYTGSCANLFRSCNKLQSVSGSLTCNGSASSMFAYCYVLADTSGLVLNFVNCTSLSSAFNSCYDVPLAQIKRFLDSCGESLTDISSLCYSKKGTKTGDAYTVIPANFFGDNCKKVTSMSSCFYGAGITSINANAFKNSNGSTALPECTTASTAFGGNGATLTSIPSNIFTFFPKLKTATAMFSRDTNLVFTLTSTIFNSCPDLENAAAMFDGCTKITIAKTDNVIAKIFASNTKLKNIDGIFNGCTSITGIVPEGFFSSNTLLETAAAAFKSTKIQSLSENSIFRASGDTTTVFSKLTNLSGMFANCSSLVFVPTANLFAGASKVTSIGNKSTSTYTGGSYNSGGLFEGCVGIILINPDVFKTMPLLQNVSQVFKDCTSLTAYSTQDGTVTKDLFSTHTNINNVKGLFNGCTSLNISVMPNFFEGSKTKITDASELFKGCTSISGFSNDILSGMTRLVYAYDAFNGCSSLDIDASELDVFDGCEKLENVSSCFKGCEGITGRLQSTLFDSCRSTLINTSSMFENCKNMTGIDVGTEDIDPENPKLGLLAECVKLTTAKAMFKNCNKLSGKIPWDMFWTETSDRRYTTLTNISEMFFDCGLNEPTKYENIDYFVHPEFFSKLVSVADVSFMFRLTYSFRANVDNHTWTQPYPISNNTFDGLYKLETIQQMFCYNPGLGGTISNTWFKNSLTSLINAFGAFSRTKITGVSEQFLRTGSSATNRKLKYAGKMFYDCPTIDGNIPRVDMAAAFSAIDHSSSQGISGYCYNCTNADNYDSIRNNNVIAVQYEQGWY